MEFLPVVASVPPEIWLKIFAFVFWDDIIFDPDPVSSIPQPHLALRSWHDTERMLEVEKQRTILRRVSGTWKDIVGTLSPYHFQSTETTNTTIDEFSLQQAHRLQLGSPGDRFNRGDGCCCRGYSYWNLPDPQEHRASSLLADHMSSIGTIRAEILIIPRSEWNALLTKPLQDVRRLLSTVRALLIEYSGLILVSIPILCPSITFLAIHATTDDSGYSILAPLALPTLSTLQLLISSEECLEWVGKWDIPSLRYLELATISEIFGLCLSDFLRNVGQELVSLQLSDAFNPISFFRDIWHTLPRVRYFGSTMMDIIPPKPPPNHPLQVLSNREHGSYSNWRDDLKEIIDVWTKIQCVSDTHVWDRVAKEFRYIQENYIPPLSSHHCEGRQICEHCVHILYLHARSVVCDMKMNTGELGPNTRAGFMASMTSLEPNLVISYSSSNASDTTHSGQPNPLVH
ncbi:hypothetical protein FRC14_005485 [Serendipita sp. 396]|nr:hypothetical protein FRC14_005485 [Serendipita sp. 396]KAG8776091.1 hypothetical protein FRC15_012129 [Serendipita sp. 397]